MTTTPDGARVLIVDDDRALRLALAAMLQQAGYRVSQAADGPEALATLDQGPVDLVLLDVGLPGMSGLEVLAAIRARPAAPSVVVMTADDTPTTLLAAIKGQAYRYVRKPFAPAAIGEIVADALSASAAAAAAVPIQVVSAKPEWVEIIAPCALEVVERIQAFMLHLDADLPEAVRESVGTAFRELLSNAIEWGGKLDRARTVRISYVRARRMLLYRIADPGEGFDIEGLAHAAISNPDDDPLHHMALREESGIRPGGFGLAITRSLVDELIYNEARNEVVFVKYLDAPPEKPEP